jgi:hypothetical protein
MMKRYETRALVKFAFAIAMTMFVASCRLDYKDNQFSNGSEFGDLQKRGWMPAWMPKEATTISERHDLDTNQVLISFNLNLGESSKWLSDAKSAIYDVSDLPKGHFAKSTAWWPPELLGDRGSDPRWRAYTRYADKDKWIIVISPSHRIYMWSRSP